VSTDDDSLSSKVNQALDARARGLDGTTLSRLHQARVHAVEQGRHRILGLTPWSAGGVAIAVIILLAVAVWGPLQQEPVEYPNPAHTIAQGEEPELLEDLDFYGWLADSRA